MENNSITYPDNLGSTHDGCLPLHFLWLCLAIVTSCKGFWSLHMKHKKLSHPPHEAVSRSLVSNGSQETLWVCSHCVRLMTAHELLFYLREHNGVCVCVWGRFTTLFTVKHLLWRISCISSKCPSSCSHLADAISCHRVNREWRSRIIINSKAERMATLGYGSSNRPKQLHLTERRHFSTLCCCWPC